MDLSEIVSISGKPGLFKVAAKREDGLIVSSFDEDRKFFASARMHMFTPLDNITIYTTEDSESLSVVLQSMKKLQETTPPVSANSGGNELKSYFKSVLPNYDEEKVYTSDIKKLIKWFEILDSNDLITMESEESKEEEEQVEAEARRSKCRRRDKRGGGINE